MLPNLPFNLAFTQGNIYHVKPYSGSDSNDGLSEDRPLKTLSQAQTLATADQNDIVLLYSESNTSASTTDYQTTTLAWAKDGVHLIGVCAGGPYNKRARVAWSSSASSGSDLPLFTLSADNCYIANVSFAVGIADANLSFGMNVTGDRNRVENVDIAWPTNATNDAAGAYALKIDGCDETLFKDCVFGSFTIDIGSAANSTLLIDSGCSMVNFDGCKFISRVEHATNSPFVKTADANALGFGCVWFKNCGFVYTSVSGGYTLTGAMTITAAQVDGRIILDHCFTNATKWDNTDADMSLIINSPTPAADTCGVTRAV
jgi:hypothetical protein